MLPRQEAMPKRHPSPTLCLSTRLTTTPNARLGTVSNSYWKVHSIYKVIPYLYVIVLSLIIYGQDPASKTGIFRAPLLQILINKIWFKNKEDDGAIHPEFSENDMLPIATIAFIQTVVSYIFYNDYDCF